MKIAVLGLSLSSSWGNGHATTYRSLLKAMAARGHDITFYERDQPWYAAARDLSCPDFCRLVLYGSLEELAGRLSSIADSDAVILGSYVTEGVAVANMLISAAARPLAFYDIDTPVTLAAVDAGQCDYLTPGLIPAFDLYLSFSGGETLRVLENAYGARRAAALPCCIDADVYRPLQKAKRWDMGYLGTYSADRQPALERLMIGAARCLPQMNFVVAGPQYPDGIDWPPNIQRIDHVPPEDHPEFYASLRFALNITRADMIRFGHSPSIRLFEASACAVPLISDRWESMDAYFSVGHEILTAETTDEVVDILTRTDARQATEIGHAARARVLCSHEASCRAAQLEEALRREIAQPQRLSA